MSLCQDKIPCALLHGFLGNKEDWTEMQHLLSLRFFCKAYDLPGHNSPLEINYLERLHQKIQSDFSRPLLIGYSMGGRLALQLAETYPSAYTHVVALSAHPGIVSRAERKVRLAQDLDWVNALHTLNSDVFLKKWYSQSLFQSLHARPKLMAQILKRRSSQDPKRMADVLRLLSVAHQKKAHVYPLPTLFLYGEKDKKYQALYSELPSHVYVQEVEASGHVLPLENPKMCAEHILRWIKFFT